MGPLNFASKTRTLSANGKSMLSMCSEETVKELLLEGAESQQCGW